MSLPDEPWSAEGVAGVVDAESAQRIASESVSTDGTGAEEASGPGRLTRSMVIVKRFRGTDGLFGMFASLIAAQFSGAALGFVYWTLAAHLYPSSQVGSAAAATSTMLLLGMFGGLGVGTLLVSLLPSARAEDRWTLMTTGLGMVCLVCLVLGLGWSLLAPSLGASLSSTGGNIRTTLVFVVGVASTGVNLAFDYVVLGVRRQRAQLAQNVIAAGGKVILVPIFAYAGVRSGLGLVTAWVIALAMSIVFTMPMLRLHRPRRTRGALARRLDLIRTHRGAAMHHYLLNLAVGSAGLLLPVVVALVSPPRQVAYFAVARLISTMVLMLPYFLTIALFAAAAENSDHLRSRVRHTMAIGLGLNVAIAVVLLPGASLVLRIFGGNYAAHGAASLRLLVLAGPLLVFKDHYVAIRRSQGRLSKAVRLAAFGVIIESAGAALGGKLWGLNGVCLCWLTALLLEVITVAPVIANTAFGWTRASWATKWL